MKTIIVACFVAIFIATSQAEDLTCAQEKLDIPHDWIDMVPPCVKMMRDQIKEEIRASLTYLAMAAHFSRDTVNRPGFAQHFFEAASEEREHAMKLIAYLLMRGELTTEVSALFKDVAAPKETEWVSGVAALKDALKLEAFVTLSIRNLIKMCEDPKGHRSDFNDYHLVDYLTGEFLEEQYKGQRDLAGKVSQLEKMMDKHGALGEFLFDKKLLE